MDDSYEITVREPQVLIVDDLPSTRLLLTDMFQEMGFTQIEVAADGKEALKKLREHGAQLVICDHSMRGMNGLELLFALKDSPDLSSIPVIMLSSNRDTPIIENALELGAADYMVKPISFKLLKMKIADVMNRRRQE
jgi:two-component system chemotaxis response regulator CheY